MQTLAIKLFQICLQYRISCDGRWVHRDVNRPADTISKIVDFVDYTINDQVFAELDIKCDPDRVDGFDCFYNTKLPHFNSTFYQIGKEDVIAFTQDWGYAKNWLFPPTVLTSRTKRLVQECQAEATLIILFLKSAIFYTVLCEDEVHCNTFVQDCAIFDRTGKLIIKAKTKNNIFTRPNGNFDIIALRISFISAPRSTNGAFCTTPRGVREDCRPFLPD